DAIEVLGPGFAQHHEELTATGVLAGVRHGERSHLVRARIVLRLALDLPPRTAAADARVARLQIAREWIASLHDEVGNDTVKPDAVVKAAVRQLLEVRHRVRGIGLIELRDHRAAVRFESGVLGHEWES